MTILDKIIAQKRKEVAEAKTIISIKDLEASAFFGRETVSFKKELQRQDKVGVIAEFKRQSPSKGLINGNAQVSETTSGYINAGATALSVLTDTQFFGGQKEDVTIARKSNATAPVLRKEFMVDEYQILEAKAMGADVILLLANVLDAKQIKHFAQFAESIGLESLLEVRDKEELQTVNEYVSAVGVNNRNLKDFQVNVSQSFDLVDLIPNEFVKVSESGLSEAKTVKELQAVGFNGFLMGETFMKTENPAQACADFIKACKA